MTNFARRATWHVSALAVAVVTLSSLAPTGAMALDTNAIPSVSGETGSVVESTGEALSQVVDTSALTVTAEGDDVSLQLPGELTSSTADPGLVPNGLFRGDDTPVLSSAVGGSTISTYATSEGSQTLVEIPSADAPSEYRFPLGLPEDGAAVALEDGSVVLLDATGDAIGGFRTPWAYDANGKSLPTHFTIDGEDLVQHIDLSAATAFPVIADPDKGKEWWGTWVRFTRAESKTIAANIRQNDASAAKSWGQIACGFAPGWYGAACAAFLEARWQMIVPAMRDAAGQGKCVAINFPAVVPGSSFHTTIVPCTR